ncbi:MAG: MBL fold metallo-hydrolase [Oscillospiraceae bacterium]|nr:MBL fold metallo-hydrolase [Oscillospiraceae bacterium]
MSKFEITFLGTNGSCAYNNGARTVYGTNTLCVAVDVGGQSLVFDAGTGIAGFCSSPTAPCNRQTLHLFLSHYHADHVCGLLFFSQLFNGDKTVNIYGGETCDKANCRSALAAFLSPPLHPVGLESFKAALNFHDIKAGQVLNLPNEIVVRTLPLSHPGGSVGYRVEHGGKAFCYCTDIELALHKNDEDLRKFLHGADLLVLDTFFDDDEKIFPGWGHSSWRENAEWAAKTGAKQLALFHYGYALTDADIDLMLQKSREIFPQTFASKDGMKVLL